jgi:hypothetical protein
MNKITTTAGLLAIGAVSLQAQQFAGSPGSIQNQKPWSISATLRGFYDDNNLTLPDRFAQESFGIEVSPSAGFNLVREQTALGLNYVYSMRWFEGRDNNEVDHTHQFNGKLSHAFTERYKVDVSDSFVIAQEPTVLDDRIITVPLRTEGDNIRNTARISFSAGITENTQIVLGYENNYYDYEQEGVGSRSAVLDRVEHLGSINLRQVILPQTIGVLGYQFGVTEYTGDDPISRIVFSPAPGLLVARTLSPEHRDNYSHYFYVGVDQGITQNLNASARVGAQYTDYHNSDEIGGLDSQWGPYADANATWTYLPGSYVQLGVRHQRSSTDIAYLGLGSTSLTQDAEFTTVYTSLSHKITAALTGSLIGQYQHATFQGGAADDYSEDYFALGVNLTYDINKWLAAEIGYNYDKLDSELSDLGFPRNYDRNRVYIGVRATF